MIIKKIKKSIIMLICILIACFGTKSLMTNSISTVKYPDSPYVGEWVAESFEYEGTKYDNVEETVGNVELIIFKDGTATFSGDGDKVEDKWEPTEDGLRLMDNGGDLLFVYKDGMLLNTLDVEKGAITLIFEKKE